MDPSAENDAAYSPFIYGFNNPMRYTDPDGRWPDWGQLGKGTIKTVGGVIGVVTGVGIGTASSVTVVGAVAGAGIASAGAGAVVLGVSQMADSFKSKGKPAEVPDIPGAVVAGVSKKLGASKSTAAVLGTITDLATGGKPKNAFDVVSVIATVADFAGTDHSANVKRPVTDHTATVTEKPKPIVKPKPEPKLEPKEQPIIKSAN